MNYPICRYSCQLVREPIGSDLIPNDIFALSVTDAINAVKTLTSLDTSPCEQLWAIFVNSRLQVTGYSLLAQGGLSDAVFDMRSLFRAAILANSKAIILAHNHPSGNNTPSPEDIKFTKEAVKAGRIMGIEVLDHLVFGLDCGAISMSANKYVKF